MWDNLPDELIKEVMTYWSPLKAHKQKIFRKMKKIKDTLKAKYKISLTYGFYENKVSTKAIKKYVSLYTMLQGGNSIRFTKKNMIVDYRNTRWNYCELSGSYAVEHYGINKLYTDRSNFKIYEQQKSRIMRFILGPFTKVLLSSIGEWMWDNDCEDEWDELDKRIAKQKY